MSPSAIALRRLVGPFCIALALTACGKSGSEGSSTVAMKDLEVVDGTTTDAMTDLDGVRAEGTAMAPVTASNGTSAVPARSTTNSTDPADRDAEVVSDQ